MQFIFKIFKFDTQSIEHRSIAMGIKYLKIKFINKNDNEGKEEKNELRQAQ
ncbi:hypothetical protein [Metaclostridioides mangenotii]|uniref:hypothetical protein n=1 Tax=Metaclostridioides mangenotii TaxID=1540 RepID=UPI000AFB5FE3|nr:hypothetical protein [Clostridioides mangenotii]